MSKFLKLFFNGPVEQAYVLTGTHLLISLIITLCIGLFMMGVYRLCHDSLTYNKKFNVTLLMLSMITTVLLALIQNNPLLSLGVLGSLSICRIRTNTKDPRDLGFVFWALSIGISSAIGAFSVIVISSLFIGVIMIILNHNKKRKHKLLMIVRGEKPQLTIVQNMFNQVAGSSVQSKNVFSETFELVYEVQEKNLEKCDLLNKLNELEGIRGVNVLAPETQVA